MKNSEFLITLAETEVAIRFHFSGTGLLFRSYEKKIISDDYDGRYLSADPEKIRAYADEMSCSMEFAEYNCLMMVVADFLTEIDCTMFHGVAFIYGSGAYILTAPSGTGKSTQYRNLRRLYGSSCRIINGDKPILGPGQNGQIIVYPSSWNGKENWAGKEHAPLRGMVILEQGTENILKEMNKHDAVLPVMEQFIYTVTSRKSVHTVCRMADSIISNIPLYGFVNRGDYASSRMLFDCIRKAEDLCH